DGKLYALRDLTATVESLPLIASSIMSKKLACRAGRLVLDVKVGAGAFMKTPEDARALADAMVYIGRDAGVRTSAVLSDMSQPEGRAIGNALEVREAVEVLQGGGPADVLELCKVLASALGVEGVERTIASGAAFEKLQAVVEAQGGDLGALDRPDGLPRAGLQQEVCAAASGYVAAVDAEALGRAAMALGAGRVAKGQAVDPAVGLVLRAKVGDAVRRGQPLVEVHANDRAKLDTVLAALPSAFLYSDRPVAAPEQATAIISAS
ncbi:MAG TPA: hypothetical protein VK009_24750, partial [Chloroflexota bacterium]|nr:hypothetical protein [Chloroflexota bacterium]